MAKFIADSIYNLQLAGLATGTSISLCNAQPTTRAEAITTFMLATTTTIPGDGNGDFVIAAGDTDGRKITIGAQAGVNVTNSGTGTHIAICDGSDVLLVTTCTSQVVTSGNTITINAFDETVRDAV